MPAWLSAIVPQPRAEVTDLVRRAAGAPMLALGVGEGGVPR
jgi:hypothetical protein